MDYLNLFLCVLGDPFKSHIDQSSSRIPKEICDVETTMFDVLMKYTVALYFVPLSKLAECLFYVTAWS